MDLTEQQGVDYVIFMTVLLQWKRLVCLIGFARPCTLETAVDRFVAATPVCAN
ncbi:MAG: hypothetical protein GVY22_02845 [Gammaproteobacteria bacterium]|jgi:hypothetical protein|nr:hypothetical protein [Gammaproteobacteria bacterium]